MNTTIKKKKILHLIDDFGRAGAETTVAGVLRKLEGYHNIAVNLYDKNEFGDELQYDQFYCLHLKSYLQFIKGIFRLRKIIRDNDVDLVHCTLYWSTIVARLATPRRIPLVASVQSSISDGIEYRKKWICLLDKWTYRWRKSIVLGVSGYTLKDYFSFLKLRPYKTHVLYNFVDTDIFKAPETIPGTDRRPMKLISVGTLKLQKNQKFMVEAFRELKDLDIELHIYGKGPCRKEMQELIDAHGLRVKLMGKMMQLAPLLPDYDLFVMSATYEGFALAVLEGMAMGVPMLLSDIPTYREQCADTARYFGLSDTTHFVQQVRELYHNPALRQALAAAGQRRALDNFTLNDHVKQLDAIYRDALKDGG
jgi:glycosyltransferase involved in cell wall biosynthesis